jgi:hypothetical protein
MSATLWDVAIAYDGAGRLLKRIEGGLIVAAGAIRTEDSGTTNHANRLIWAAQVETGALVKARQMLGHVMGEGIVAKDLEATTDETLSSIIAKLIDVFATGE